MARPSHLSTEIPEVSLLPFLQRVSCMVMQPMSPIIPNLPVNDRHKACREQYRFRKAPVEYLAALEEKFYQ